MAHLAPATTHRRPPPAAGPVLTVTWLGLAFGMLLGAVAVGRTHIGVRAGAFTLLVMILPLTVAVFAYAIRRGFGSKGAAVLTATTLVAVVLRVALL